ncbi:MAG: cadherin repeat domain-containing protein [Burkholderiaceae bacterium]
MTIALTNVEDPPSLPSGQATIAENTPNGTVVLTMVATDPDLGDTLEYVILTSSAPGALRIDAATGEIAVADSNLMNFEARSEISLSIIARDSTGLVDVASARILLTDVNEPPHSLNLDSSSAPLLPNQVIGTVRASDPDNGDVLTFSLMDDANGSLVLNASTGVLSLSATPSLNASSNTQIQVTVTDAAGLQSTRTFSVNLIDVSAPTPPAPPPPPAPPAPEPAPGPEPVPEPEPGTTSEPPGVDKTSETIESSVTPKENGLSTVAEDDEVTRVSAGSGPVGSPERVKNTSNIGSEATAGVTANSTAPDASDPQASLDMSGPALQSMDGDFTQWVLDRLSIRRGEVSFVIDSKAVAFESEETAKQSITALLSDPLQAGGAVISSAAFWWGVRAAGLLTSLLIGTPAWRSIDPLPIVGDQGVGLEGIDDEGSDELPI